MNHFFLLNPVFIVKLQIVLSAYYIAQSFAFGVPRSSDSLRCNPDCDPKPPDTSSEDNPSWTTPCPPEPSTPSCDDIPPVSPPWKPTTSGPECDDPYPPEPNDPPFDDISPVSPSWNPPFSTPWYPETSEPPCPTPSEPPRPTTSEPPRSTASEPPRPTPSEPPRSTPSEPQHPRPSEDSCEDYPSTQSTTLEPECDDTYPPKRVDDIPPWISPSLPDPPFSTQWYPEPSEPPRPSASEPPRPRPLEDSCEDYPPSVTPWCPPEPSRYDGITQKWPSRGKRSIDESVSKYPHSGIWFMDIRKFRCYFEMGSTLFVERRNHFYSKWISSSGNISWILNDFYLWTWDAEGRWFSVEENQTQVEPPVSFPNFGFPGDSTDEFGPSNIRYPADGLWYTKNGTLYYRDEEAVYELHESATFTKYVNDTWQLCPQKWNYDFSDGLWKAIGENTSEQCKISNSTISVERLELVNRRPPPKAAFQL